MYKITKIKHVLQLFHYLQAQTIIQEKLYFPCPTFDSGVHYILVAFYLTSILIIFKLLIGILIGIT